jgi:hypothetical protein
MVSGQDGPHVEEDEMYPNLFTALGASRIQDWREEAARDRLVKQARQAKRAAAPAGQRHRPGSRWWARRAAAAVPAHRVPADATPDQWASALSVPPAESAGADDRQPVGGRAA